MKKSALIFVLSLTLLFSGCNNGTSDSDSSMESTSQTDPVSTSESSEVPDENSTKLVGLAGDRISKSEISQVFNLDGSSEYSDESFQSVLCDGFVYLAEPTLNNLNSIDNSDIFDADAMTFARMSAGKLKNYKRVNVGDTISGLTVTAAQSNFAVDSMDGFDKNALYEKFPEIYFNAANCEFSGELTMTGYACVIPEDEYGIESGTILFVPSGECPLPVMGYASDEENGIYHCANIGMHGDFTWAGEYGQINIGNINSVSADVSVLPTDGTFVKVAVTVDSIKLSGGVNFNNIATANIVEINPT
ncbi:MAG: hypothetical protein K2N06_07590 [Oscillospiraceae bacterium]|nr:hypothetical protein [Oscillospiraceae bacterium]